ncbi:MAG: NADH-quinone oxidoreductase subunit J [Actinomycetota bacterium]
MTGQEIVFSILAVGAGVAAALVVTTKNVVRGALLLVAMLGSIGALFLLMGAEFLGWTQILIYVGAIVVLLLFGVMLTKAPIGSATTLDNQQRGAALIVAVTTFGVLTYLIWRAFGHTRIAGGSNVVRTAQIDTSLFTKYVLPFEAVSVLLLAALVGAIVLARRDR